MKYLALISTLFMISQGSAQVITDSLVQNLSCQNLSVETILGSIREDAFAAKYQFPISNWPFKFAGAPMANCWGLSSMQRKLFYLARFEQSSDESPESTQALIFNTIRGKGKKPYSIIPIADESFQESLRRNPKFFLDLTQFRTEIQRAEIQHFFRPKNAALLIGATSERTQLVNQKTVKHLVRNLKAKRLTTLILRFTTMIQHAVVAKTVKTDQNGNLIFTVYDSNQPFNEGRISYSQTTQQFEAINIATHFKTVKPDGNHVGIFIVDEDERIELEKTLLNHYQSLCLNPQ